MGAGSIVLGIAVNYSLHIFNHHKHIPELASFSLSSKSGIQCFPELFGDLNDNTNSVPSAVSSANDTYGTLLVSAVCASVAVTCDESLSNPAAPAPVLGGADNTQ